MARVQPTRDDAAAGVRGVVWGVRREKIFQEAKMHTLTDAKWRITIPTRIRQRLGIKKRTRVHVEIDEQKKRVILTPITREYVHAVRGSLKGEGAMKVFLAERKWERELQDQKV